MGSTFATPSVTIRIAVLLAGVILSMPSLVRAESEKQFQVEVEARFEPTSAVGLILSPAGTVEKKPTNVEHTKNGRTLITVPYFEREVKADTMVSAMMVGADGELAFANVRPLTPNAKDTQLVLPDCPKEMPKATIAHEQYGTLQTLAEYRNTRRELTRLKVARLLDGSFLQRLQDMERGLGLGSDTALSGTMNPVALIDRLSRLVNTLKNVKAYREERQRQQAAAEAKEAQEKAAPNPSPQSGSK